MFTDSKPSFSHETISADTSLECGDALCMARNTGVLTGGRKKKKSAYTCHGLLRTRSQMLPSSPVGNYSSLKGCWGTLGVAGRGGLCVRVSKREVGVAPDVCSKGASTAQHTSTSQRRRLTPDLYPSTPGGPKQRGSSTPYIKVTYLISYRPESQLPHL